MVLLAATPTGSNDPSIVRPWKGPAVPGYLDGVDIDIKGGYSLTILAAYNPSLNITMKCSHLASENISYIFWISSKCFNSSNNYENFANLKRAIWKHVIKHGQEKRHFLKDLIPCMHFSNYFKNLENLGGVKLKHLLKIQNTLHDTQREPHNCRW